MNISDYAKENELELTQVKEVMDKHHRAILTDEEIAFLDVQFDLSLSGIPEPTESCDEPASGTLEVDEDEVIEIEEEDLVEETMVKPDWCTKVQWMNLHEGVFAKEEKLRQFNGL